MFKHCWRRRRRQRRRRQRRRQRTPEQGYTISSPCEPDGSGELIIQKLWSYWTFWFALYLIQREIIWKLYIFWEHGPILKQTKWILNADTLEPRLRNNLIYSDRKGNSYSDFHCFSNACNWDYSFRKICTRKTFSVFVGGCQVYSLVQITLICKAAVWQISNRKLWAFLLTFNVHVLLS